MKNISCLSIPLIERELLTKKDYRKVFHLSFDVGQYNISYEAGDILGVYPKNHPHIVQSFITTFNFDKDKLVYFSRENRYLSLWEYLRRFANLNRIPGVYKSWLEEKYNQDFSLYRFHEVLCYFKKASFCVEEQELVDRLSFLLPRFYSIASYCPPEDKEKKVDLLVNLVVIKEDPLVFGTCSHYLCSSLSLRESANVFFKKSETFFLAKDSEDKPIIMIGTGTGLAPFRAFLQKRRITSPLAGNYLFFGDHHYESNFYYKNFFMQLKEEKILELFLSFSRDREEKIYVQHLLLQQKSLLLSVLDRKVYIFVCGSKVLGKSVDSTLLDILQEQHGAFEAEHIIKTLRAQGRYVKDVY